MKNMKLQHHIFKVFTYHKQYELAISNFEKYRWDDNFALVRKCCFALGDINTPKAKEKLELLLQSEEETIREHAMEQLKRCDFTNKDIE